MYRLFCFFTSCLILAMTISLLSCTKMGPEKNWDNPYDPDGSNWSMPIVTAPSDTSVAVNKPIILTAAGFSPKRSMHGFLWSFNNGRTWDTVLLPAVQTHSWNIYETGANLVLVRAVDSEHFESSPDSFIVTVHRYVPALSPVPDTIVGQNSEVIKHVNAFDTNSTALKYFWSIDNGAMTDTTDEPHHSFSNPRGGPLAVRWGVVDDEGNSVSDTFVVLFNRGPQSLALTEPLPGKAAPIVSYNYESGEGKARFSFAGDDPDGNADTLSYTFLIGLKTDRMAPVYSGTAQTILAEHLWPATIYYWKLRVRDLFGDSLESSGSFATLEVLPAPEGMKLVRSRSKSFIMGQSGFDTSHLPLHTVSFSYHFWMDSTEVTAHEFSLMMGFGDSSWSSSGALPAAHCTWHDAVLYCNARSRAEGKDTVYSYQSISGVIGDGGVLSGVKININVDGYRLPTEAEWEYACRAETQSTFFWGEGRADAAPYAWTISNSDGRMHPVAGKKPNDFGLYDMGGNVGEWCNDWYASDYYGKSPATDPLGPEDGSERVIRGGSFQDNDLSTASGKRGKTRPDAASVTIGFRAVLINR
jgi:formylglycine-generating enzyme required for sulfatase activity